MSRKFDLNIDQVLESWEPHHAIRELIANALDEQMLTNSAAIQVVKNRENVWSIRDFGRGLRYEHLIQTEDPEKLKSSSTIGKFGVGLKDALATLWRHNVHVEISSKYGQITLDKCSKHEFEQLLTLHACVEAPTNIEMIGTEILLSGCDDKAIEQAKKMFLCFSDSRVMEETQYGQVISGGEKTSNIYLNGMIIAHEPNFLFSYNITSPNAAIRRALNRERMHVGRAAYADRIKMILTGCVGNNVTNALSDDLERLSSGDNHDELSWLEVQAHACGLLNARKSVIFVTPEERTDKPQMVDRAQSDGFRPVTIPERLRERISDLPSTKEPSAEPVRVLSKYERSYSESFQYSFLEKDQLSPAEQEVLSLAGRIFEILGGKPEKIQHILISETMRVGDELGFDANGVWSENDGSIIIKRSILNEKERFLGTLLHEIAHAISGAPDISRSFEDTLSRLLGRLAISAIPDHDGLTRFAIHTLILGALRTRNLAAFSVVREHAFVTLLSNKHAVVYTHNEHFCGMIEKRKHHIAAAFADCLSISVEIEVCVDIEELYRMGTLEKLFRQSFESAFEKKGLDGATVPAQNSAIQKTNATTMESRNATVEQVQAEKENEKEVRGREKNKWWHKLPLWNNEEK